MASSSPNLPRVILYLDVSRGFGRGLLAGISRFCSVRAHWIFYRRKPFYLPNAASIDLQELRNWRPDGVFYSMASAKEIEKLEVPMVACDVNGYRGRIPRIVTDDAKVGKLAAEHLLSQGHRRFAFIGYKGLAWSKHRQNSFCAAIREAGFEASVFSSLPDGSLRSLEDPLIQDWIDSLPKPVGLFCGNDDRASEIIEACLDCGYQVPDDISIIGADDDKNLCELSTPPLSSVQVATEQAGYEAAVLLDRLMRGDWKMDSQQITVQAKGVKIRQSTDVLMIGNPEVRKALRFIRENVQRPIMVGDVVKATGVCHRSLNDKFKEELGGSIRKYLTRARIEVICRLLVDTDLRIQEVADAVGYEDYQHFARYFSRAMGMTPQAYRRKMLAP